MLKRSVAILATTACLAFALAPSAQAAPPEDVDPYGAGAAASALTIQLADLDLTFSATGVAISSKPEAAANGQAVTLVDTEPTVVTSTGAEETAQDCVLPIDLPAPIDITGIDIACVDMAAAVTGEGPASSSESGEITIAINSSAEAVQQLIDLLLEPLLTEILAPITATLTSLGLSLDPLVALLLADLSNGGNLAEIEVAPTSSTASAIASRAEAQGVTLSLLPDLLPGVGSIADVVVGDSFASAVYNPETGEVDTDGKAAFLSVDLSGLELLLNALLGQVLGTVTGQLPPGPISDVVQALLTTLTGLISGLDSTVEDVVNVTVDQLACPGSPLAALLCFTAGSVHDMDAAALTAHGFEYGEGTTGIQADVLSLNVLDDLLVLGVGQTAAAANGIPAQDPPTTTVPDDPETQRPLPTTGGTPALPLAMLLFGAAAGAAVLVRRSRTV
jgi:hypothetical protein